MAPYYDEGGITIYLGDCRDVLPTIGPESVDLVLTDPPYNVGKDYGEHDDSMPLPMYRDWLRGILDNAGRVSRNSVVFFPGQRNAFDVGDLLAGTGLRPYRLLGWHRKEFAGDKWNGGPAMSWEPIVWAVRDGEKPAYVKRFGTWGRDFFVVNATHGDPYAALHPCPKPYDVMRWLVGVFCPEGGTVLDPFGGTGTTARAAKDLGRRCVLIEREERYCEIAAKRLQQAVLPLEVVS